MNHSDDEKIERALAFLYHATRNPDLVEAATGWYRSFPIDSGPRVLPSKKAVTDFNRHFSVDVLEAVKEMWAELLKLSIEEIDAEFDRYKHAKWQEEQDNYIFNQPDACFIDLDFWARAATWTDEQAVMLSLNRHPLLEYLDGIKNLSAEKIQESEVAMSFFDRVALAKSARDAGQISANGKSIDFVQWFQRMEFETREDLIERVHHYQSDQPVSLRGSKEVLMDREKQTLLKLIAAMAIKGYRFDPKNARNAATADIKSDLELLGFQLDDKTILKWLRRASELVDEDLSEQD